jgi:uncharacterized membrane protein
MAGDKSSFQSRPPIVDSTKLFQYDIKTHLPYRDVVMEKQDLNECAYILVDREWVIGATALVCVLFVYIVRIFRFGSNHSHQQEAGDSVIIYHVG